MSYFSLLAFLAGAAIAAQAGMNAQLGMLLKNSLLGTAIAFSSSFLFTLLAVFTFSRDYPSTESIYSVPFYLWFSGGVLSAFGISMIYYLIPQMGLGSMMSYGLSGQILVSMIAGHFGWFDLPVRPINVIKFIGLVAMITGIILINKE